MTEQLNSIDTADAVVTRAPGAIEQGRAMGVFDCVCHDKDGNEKWRDVVHNTVINEGKDNILNSALGPGSATVAIKMGIIDGTSNSNSPAPALGDTYASHPLWTELGTGVYAARLAITWNASGSGSKLANSVTFTALGNGQAWGPAMFFTASTVPQNAGTGIILSAGQFTGGPRTVISGDQLTVAYTFTI